MRNTKSDGGSGRHHFFPALLIAIALCCYSVVASAYVTAYSFTIDTGGNAVTNGMILERGPGMGHNILPWEFSDGTTSIQLGWPAGPEPTRALIIGIVNGLPADGNAPVDHMALFMNDTTASATQGVPWESVFPNTPELDLIANLKLATTVDPLDPLDPDRLDAFYAVLDWADGEATTANAWFATGETFTVQTWSDGLPIGSGTSSVISDISTVPEPSTFGLLGLGLVGLGWARVRRRTN